MQKYAFTAHAAVVIERRGIAVTWIVRVLSNPDRVERDKRHSGLLHALGRVAERDDRVLRVIYNPSVNPPRVVTAYFDRRARGKT